MRITVLDNDPDQAAAICDALAALGHSCSTHKTGKATLDELRHEASDLLIANWQVPDIPATDLVALAREATDSRILILATVARAAEQDEARQNPRVERKHQEIVPSDLSCTPQATSKCDKTGCALKIRPTIKRT